MDIDPTHLSLLRQLGKVLAERAGVEMKFTSTTDPRKALEGATFVFPGYRIGGVEHLNYDFEIPTKHGIVGDETAGPGGTFMAQCTIPATVEYCRIIEELCPDAWVISYVNPTNFVADAVRRATKAKFIAICDGITGCETLHLPEILGVPPGEVSARAIGFNHATWVVDLRVGGEDGYPLLRERLQEFEIPEHSGHYERLTWEFGKRLFETYGYWNVTPTHCRMMWEHDEVLEEIRSRPIRPDSYLARIQTLWDFIEQVVDGAEYDPDRPFLHRIHAVQPVGIMVSIVTNEGREWGGINFPNNGAISNLPVGAIVEGPCIVDARGPVPITMGDLPKPFVGLTQHIINWQELTVDAALSGNKGVLYQALLACPYVHDMKAAKTIMDELLVAHADYMPQFKE